MGHFRCFKVAFHRDLGCCTCCTVLAGPRPAQALICQNIDKAINQKGPVLVCSNSVNFEIVLDALRVIKSEDHRLSGMFHKKFANGCKAAQRHHLHLQLGYVWDMQETNLMEFDILRV